ncbi:ATP-dependent RecD-like DNA helicase, partial [bacterium]|nr:ATP-dependent RecD-like DNA helicase [bacterium]
GVLPGIGEKIALRILGEFGEDSLKILNDSPEKYLEIEGIGKKKLEEIKTRWQSLEDEKRTLLYFTEKGLSLRLASKLMSLYGSLVVDVIEENPYILCHEVDGIGFKRADEIARRIGFAEDSPKRVLESIVYILQNASKRGHIFLPIESLVSNCVNLLDSHKISMKMIDECIAELKEQNRIVMEEDTQHKYRVYFYNLWFTEEEIVHNILRILKKQDKLKIIENAVDFFKTNPSHDQMDAFYQTLSSGFLIITGGPGTGKTTLISAICSYYLNCGYEVLIAAPTGRAAKRITESTGFSAKTIHRMLEFAPFERKFKKNSKSPLNADIVIIDEASMIDYSLMFSLLDAISDDTRLVLIGDVDQLPSVGPGNVLRDLIDSGKVPVSKLTTIHRQEEGSLIVENAHRINCGDWKEVLKNLGNKEFQFIRKDDPKQAIDELRFSVLKDIKENEDFNHFDYQVISPMNRGPSGTLVLNCLLKMVYNRNRKNSSLKKGDYVYSSGDKVMQIVNNYDKGVFNGDMGSLIEVDEQKKEFILLFGDMEVTYSFSEIDQILPAYAITVHKSQGSEFKKVYLLLNNHHHVMLQRNLIYTAVTRAKKSIKIIGSDYAFKKAISTEFISSRFTSLKMKIIEKFK